MTYRLNGQLNRPAVISSVGASEKVLERPRILLTEQEKSTGLQVVLLSLKVEGDTLVILVTRIFS